MLGIVIGIIVALIVLILIYVFATYNSLIGLKNNVEEGFATMDVYLKKRWDLIPNLVETVKGYAKHEQETLEEVIRLRNSAYDNMSEDDKLKTNEELGKGITKIMALAENYPDLKANQNFLELSGQLSKVEEDIANSRKYYNAVVRNFNNKVEMFPSNIIAGLFKFTKKKMFETTENERENVKVSF